MILSTEQLRQKAHDLGLKHDSYVGRCSSKYLWREFYADIESLRAFVRSLQDGRASCSQPAEEWLLDHAEFIEEQALVVRHRLSGAFLRCLPRLRKSGEPRVLSLCSDYLKHADGILDEDSLVSYINFYQEVSVLTIAEAWSIPLMLRVALTRRLAEIMELVRERREVCSLVERLLAQIEPSKLNPDTLRAALEDAGQDIPLSGPLIAHLVSHLREWADDSATVREWLLCKLENGPDSLDRIVSYEYQLQAAYQVAAGNVIGSLRKIERWDWSDPFEQICLVERTLRQESTGVYPLLDFSSRDQLRRRVEELARRLHVPENLVAKQAVELAAGEHERACAKVGRTNRDDADGSSTESAELPRQAFAAYYLLEPAGVRELRSALQICGRPRLLPEIGILRRATGVYFTLLAGLFALALLGFAAWIGGGVSLTPTQWAVIVLALAFPASEWAVTAVHWLIECGMRPRPLLRYDFSHGIPAEATTMVVIPVIWSTVEEVQELVDRLELHYLANRDPNIHYALLGDFVDADEESLPEDTAVLAAARESIEALNRTYSRPGGTTFHLFQRRRLWNPSEGVWMGWERKRGKLVEFVELLKGRTETAYDFVVGDSAVLSRIRYIITLDADTKLPMGSAQRMIGTLHLPYNRPRLNRTRTRVVEGYGVLQPRIGISHEAAVRSRFAYLWSGEPGIDPYAFAVSDPYQDGLGQGIFTGKGIFDVDMFAQVLCERIPENRVLSHDLLEGGFLRAGLLSDIELIDDHPAAFSSYQKRLHRWVRGDWQLLCWLFPRVCDRRGVLVPVDLSALTRWQMIDNLRRSLLPPALFGLLLLGLTVLPGSPGRWLAIVFAALFLPVIRQLAAIRRTVWRTRRLLSAIGQVLVIIWTLPFQSALLLDAIARSLNRLFISKRHLLEWVSSSEIERRNRRGRHPALLGVWGGYTLVLLFILAVGTRSTSAVQWTGLALSALWALAPLGLRWLDRPVAQPERPLEPAEEEELRVLAKQIWAFFEDFTSPKDNWLPPDNVQIDPPNGVAHRTSPTNIGLYLASTLAARDFGFIDTPGLIERLERTIKTVERLDKWKGHLYNWYDTVTLEPLPPLYVSTVDSGNFVAYLMVVKEGLGEWLKKDFAQSVRLGPVEYGGKGSEAMNVEFSVELMPRPDTETNRRISAEAARKDWVARGQNLIARIDEMINETDFRPLYDHKAKLFTLGYHAALDERDTVLYDLLASEARQASFVAIALGQVSVAHWHALGRTMTKIGPGATLLSWSGTMFEYLMPWSIMRTYRNTVWDSTYRAVVQRQIEYAHQRGVPFGISESGYYAFDYQMNYQYRAFGVPGLGFKRGLEQDLVVAPYAAILALPFSKRQVLEDLRKMEELGARGTYGYYEAIDFTAERMPKDQTCMVIRSFMAHHQGMSLLTLANLLLPQKMYERFHSDKRVQAAELLLQERIPERPAIIEHRAKARVRLPDPKPAQTVPLREYLSADTPTPEVCVLSNGTFMSVVTNSGSGFSRYEGVAVSRWREDPVADDWGSYMYIRDVTCDVVWSPTFQPCRVPSPEQRVQFALERATFMRVDGDVQTSLEICVSPEWNAEVRRLTLTNSGSETRIIEVTTFLEVALAPPIADDAHPAFSKLFVETEYAADDECLLARRRSRDGSEKPLWAVHSLMVGGRPLGPVEYETDRASFINRGHKLSQPQGIRSRLRGTVGAVADPAFIMRRRLTIEPGERVQLFAITGVAETKDEAISIVHRFSGDLQVERTFQLAWTRSQIELRHLHLTAAEAMVFQSLAGQALYAAPLRGEREKSIAANSKGQSGLWAYGVSGDWPIVLVRIADVAHIQFVVKLLIGHEYLRRKGLLIDLVILNESEGGYQQNLQEALRRAVDHGVERHGAGPGSVFVIAANQLPDEEKTLLLAVSRIVLRADGPSLRAQIRLPRSDTVLPAPLEPTAPLLRNGNGNQVSGDVHDLVYFNGWGGFSPDGREYRIVLKNGNHLPAPWINVIANRHFGCLVSELGTGYTWWRNSREWKLTPWSNDPVLDPPGEVCYLRDEESGEMWSVHPSPAHTDKPYIVSHGRGYTRFRHESHGLMQEATVFVPVDYPVKVIKLRLQNRTAKQRRLSVTYYAEWVLGVRREANASFIVTEWDESANILVARNTYQEAFRDATVFLGVFPQPNRPATLSNSADSEAQPATLAQDLSWTADRKEFIGRNGTLENPSAMGRERLSGNTGALYDACGAVQAKLTLEPNEERTVYILLGCEHSHDTAVKLAQKYSQTRVCEQSFERVRDFWDSVLDQISVSTPCPEMDVLLNGWLIYQTLACRMWARSAFYQAGGAYGFRDQLQDSLALLHTRPDLTRAQILLHAAHQYEEGDVQHWWHEETERGIRTRFSDDLLWLPYAVTRYIEHTGDDSLLEEMVPFLHSEPLREDEHERYEPTRISKQSGTVFEHCLRAIDRALRFGEHGLPLIGIGDWNDGMNRVGEAGRGESVWLGWFMCEILNRFEDLCERFGDVERASRYRDVRQQLAVSLDEHAWDGQWYRRAFTDAGQWLGSIHNEECRIDAIAQSWSVISEVAPKDKTTQAMHAFDRELVDRDLSVARLLTPPFDRTEPSPGYIQGYPPGIRENGAQYTHGVIWSIVAWCRLGNGEKALELFHMLNPITHTRTPGEVRQYAGEPYVMAADVYTTDPHKGHAGWTWYTGAAGWMYQAGIEWILGLRRRGERLYIRPCIPCEWPEFSVSYRYGSSRYLITVKNPSGKSSGGTTLMIDGQEVDLLEPTAERGPYVELCDDGQVHHVVLTM
ncbi:GH36-type glycosyl hydrolase domain-containing protein [Effusibacillus consociatus]|uniref:GH36-type glycosyl hydrolase domain-containing protein n=1 Tax=Effusibacillus consociatus TaxID=1117041 RepID=A0ABV9QAC7_9BACL